MTRESQATRQVRKRHKTTQWTFTMRPRIKQRNGVKEFCQKNRRSWTTVNATYAVGQVIFRDNAATSYATAVINALIRCPTVEEIPETRGVVTVVVGWATLNASATKYIEVVKNIDAQENFS